MDAEFKVTVESKEYLIKKRYFAFTGSALFETDDFDLPRDQWNECEEVLPLKGVMNEESFHDHTKPIMLVGCDSEHRSAITEALSQRGHNPQMVYIDEASTFDLKKFEDFDLSLSESIKEKFMIKKGRRRGQR